MIDLENSLKEFEQKYHRQVVLEDNVLYEIIDGQRKQVRVESAPRQKHEKKYDDSGIPIIGFEYLIRPTNFEYEKGLSEADKALRKIIIDHIDNIIDQELIDEGLLEKKGEKYVPRFSGVCHIFWGKKKKLLKEVYGISWASQQDENPHVMYD